MSVSPISPKIVVTSAASFWRTSDLRETSAVSQQLNEAQEAAGDQMVVGGAFFQESKACKLKHLLTGALTIGAPALVATGLVVAGLTALPGMLLIGGLALFSGLASVVKGAGLQNAAKDYVQALKVQDVEGLDVWRSGGPARDIAVEKSSPAEDGLREMAIANMRDYPSSLHILHANGHGLGTKYTAGMPGAVFAKAANDSVAKGGHDWDVVLLDTCFGANFESMASFGTGVKQVVAFEDSIPNANSRAGRIPLDTMLTDALDDTSGRAIAIEMAQTAAAHFEQPGSQKIANVPVADRLDPAHLEKLRQGTDSTVVAVDVQALKSQLAPALDDVGVQLSRALDENPGLRTALDKARHATSISPDGDLVDLGGFLGQMLEQAPTSGPLRASIEVALKSLDQTLLFKRTGQIHPLSGLSVHTRENPGAPTEIAAAPTRPLDGEQLPQGWVEFIKKAF